MKLDDAILDKYIPIHMYTRKNDREKKNYCYDHFSGDIR